MHALSSSLLFGLGLLSALAAATPAPLPANPAITFTVTRDAQGEIESFKNATAMGVDIFGPIPDDGVRLADRVVADPGTKAWAWMRAQVDIDWASMPEEQYKSVQKRQGPANIGIGMWAQDNCEYHPAATSPCLSCREFNKARHLLTLVVTCRLGPG
jgi:hypothetical protein